MDNKENEVGKDIEGTKVNSGTCGNLSCPEGKAEDFLKRSANIERENKELNSTIRQQEKQIELITKERDNFKREYQKAMVVREKLEEVCREQQKLLKAVKNESLAKIREEEKRRKENQIKFQHSIDEINATLNKNNKENCKLKEDNVEMKKKLLFLAEQYQVREKQLEKINEQIQLEAQLNEAKLEKAKVEAAIEREVLLKEKQAALDEIAAYKKAIQEFECREEVLKEQLAFLSSKHKDFQSSLQNSNDMFVSYKGEIEKMHNVIKRLEKDSSEWKSKCEKSSASVIELATEKQDREVYISKMMQQIQQLQKLLRALQAERTMLHKTLKENNIGIPTIQPLPAEPSFEMDKLDIMAKNCTELKKTLAKLQNEMNEITLKKEGLEPDQNKKSERKKNKRKS